MKIYLILLIFFSLYIVSESKVIYKSKVSKEYRLSRGIRVKMLYKNSCKHFKKYSQISVSSFDNGSCLPIVKIDNQIMDRDDLTAEVQLLKFNVMEGNKQRNYCVIYFDSVFSIDNDILTDGYLISVHSKSPFKISENERRVSLVRRPLCTVEKHYCNQPPSFVNSCTDINVVTEDDDNFIISNDVVYILNSGKTVSTCSIGNGCCSYISPDILCPRYAPPNLKYHRSQNTKNTTKTN